VCKYQNEEDALEIASLQSELGLVRSQLLAAQNELADEQLKVSQISEELLTTRTQLSEAQDKISCSADTITDLGDQLNTLRLEVSFLLLARYVPNVAKIFLC